MCNVFEDKLLSQLIDTILDYIDILPTSMGY